MRRRPDHERVLATVLFLDIVGSTEEAARLGDAAWRDLVARHHAGVRRELRRFGGREQDTAGDGFFATFERPLAAIRCAAAVIVAVSALGLRERAAIHTGECEVIEGKLGGIAVHTAARLLALGGPSEILVSATTRELVAGAGLGFNDRGLSELRGLPEPVHVYAIEDVSVLAASGPAAGEVRPSDHLRGSRLATTTAAVAIVAILGLVIAAFASRGVGSPGFPTSPASGSSATAGSPGSPTASGGADLPGNLPAGPIAPGTYLLTELRGGAVMTIPQGWATYGRLYLSPVSYPATHLSFDQWPAPGSAACGATAPPAAASDEYRGWVDWFTHHPALATGPPGLRLFGDTGATQLDVTVVPDKACHNGVPPTVSLDARNFDSLAAGTRTRVYLLDRAPAILVVLEAPTEDEFQVALPQVEAMLASLRFPQR